MHGSATLTIGGIPLTLVGGDSLARALTLPSMEVFRSNNADGDGIRLCLDTPLTLPECRWLHRFDIADGATGCGFGVDTEGIYHYSFGDSGLMRFDPRQPDRVEVSPIANPSLLHFVLWTAYSMAGLWHSAVPVHSSVVVCHGRAVLCLGESGTGKSTHTALWVNHIEGSYLLNDDSPILRVEAGEAVVYGSPWSGKTPCFRQERVPVAALLRLEQRPENAIRRLGTVEAFTALQPSCPPALTHDERTMDLLVDFIGGVIHNTPVYRLGCRPDANAARLAYSTIMA